MTSQTQTSKILQHIRSAGHITLRDAYVAYGIASFTRRIADLRAEGFQIISESARHPVDGARYTRYKFAENTPRTRAELREWKLKGNYKIGNGRHRG